MTDTTKSDGQLLVAALRRGASGLLGSVFYHEKIDVRSDGRAIKRKAFTLKKVVTTLAVLWGLSFSLFMIEEAIQTSMFSTFMLQEVNDYERLYQRAVAMETMGKTGSTLNNLIGWVNPFMWIGYNLYFEQATPDYVDSLKTIVAARAGSSALVAARESNITSPVLSGLISQPPAVQFDFPSGRKIGPPVELSSPIIPGAIVLDEHEDMMNVVPLENRRATITFPCTYVDERAKVIMAETPFGFTVVAFDPDSPGWAAVLTMENKWVTINDKVEFYEAGGVYQFILNDPQDIVDMRPLTAEL